MSRFVRIGLVIAAATVLVASAAMASVPDPNNSVVAWRCSSFNCEGLCLFPSVCPNGDDGNKPTFAASPSYIDLTVRDQFGAFMAGIPGNEIYATMCAACDVAPPRFYAAGPTDVAGYTFIVVNRIGGCCNVVPVYVQGVNMVDLQYRSYDFNGDLSVDLSDLTFLARTYNTGDGCSPPAPDPDYNECFDFTCDDCVDLSDLTLFAKHYNHDCDFPL
jgi:hypothetical protein